MAQQQVGSGHRLRKASQAFRRWRKSSLQRLELGWGNLLRPVPERASLLILDDFFPDLRTGFRLAEFHYLLNRYQNVVIFSTNTQQPAGRFPLLKKIRSFSLLLRAYRHRFSQQAEAVYKFNRLRRIKADAAYMVFINNADKFLEYLESNLIPFIFTLYPGGGFQLRDQVSDQKLARVFASPLFRGVIVTQDITRQYLLENRYCAEEKIFFAFGLVVDSSRYTHGRELSAVGTPIRICFVAYKYMSRGLDKGYDIFIEMCHELQREPGRFSFHVVGNFSREDLDVTALGDAIHYHGALNGDDLQNFYSGMDIIVAPNRAYTLAPGAFDGFPTGCCVEAALYGVAVFSTDPLQQNRPFVDGEHCVLIELDPAAIAAKIRSYCAEPERLLALKRSGQARFTEIYAIEQQMRPRLAAIDCAMGKDGSESLPHEP